jgi:hypothetical protein
MGERPEDYDQQACTEEQTDDTAGANSVYLLPVTPDLELDVRGN